MMMLVLVVVVQRQRPGATKKVRARESESRKRREANAFSNPGLNSRHQHECNEKDPKIQPNEIFANSSEDSSTKQKRTKQAHPRYYFQQQRIWSSHLTSITTVSLAMEQSRPLLHVHIVCTQEISARSIFKACMALQDSEQHRRSSSSMTTNPPQRHPEELYQLLQDLGLDEHGVHYRDMEKCIFAFSERIGSDLREKADLLGSVCNTLDLLRLYLRSNDIEEMVDVQAITGSLWYLSHFGIQTVSCGPLRVSSQAIAEDPALFQGLPIEIDDSKALVTSIRGDGLALFQTLLSEHVMIRQGIAPRKSPPPMILRSSIVETDGTMLFMGECQTNDDEPSKAGSTDTWRSQNASLSSSSFLEKPDLWNVDRNMVQLAANIDDMTPEHLAFATELLMQQQGVVDCWLDQIVMKKGRSAHTLHCLCCEGECEQILRLIFQHTTTLGVRVQSQNNGLSRVALKRKMIRVPVEIQGTDGTTFNHAIDCKIGYLGADEIVSIKPEFEQCKAVALSTQRPFQWVSEKATSNARSTLQDEQG